MKKSLIYFMETRLSSWQPLATAAMGGALIPFSMAPYSLWLAGLLGLCLIAWSLRNATTRQSLARALVAGLAIYTSGVYWVYIAIAQFGASSAGLAFILTALFIVALAVTFALPFALYGRYMSRAILGQTVGFAALWVLGEWTRSWFLTGFPWLYVGYGHLDTPLSGYAPITGIFGVSFMAASTSAIVLAIYLLFWQQQKPLINTTVITLVILCCAIWGGGYGLQHVPWTKNKPHPIHIGLMQPNIPQEHKWDPEYHEETLAIFSKLSEPLWDLDWVIWPEAAIPYPYHQAAPLIEQIDEFAHSRGTVFITGIIYDDYTAYKYYNAIIARGSGSGEYFKQRLVPFGEYVPFEKQLRGLIAFFNLPTSIIHIGPFNPLGLNANGVLIAANVCYEITYPDLIAELAIEKDVILTISNDAWFGASIGPLQHFDMARMRAIETGRYVIRATNNGLSGFIAPDGSVLKTGGRFTRETITGEVYRTQGTTPFMIWRSWPVVLLMVLIITSCALIQRRS